MICVDFVGVFEILKYAHISTLHAPVANTVPYNTTTHMFLNFRGFVIFPLCSFFAPYKLLLLSKNSQIG